MKSIFTLMLLATSFANAEKMVCLLDGSVKNIVQVQAVSTGSRGTESIQSFVTYKEGLNSGDSKAEVFTSEGILNKKSANFEFTSELESGPFGIQKAFIVFDGKNFNLEVRNYCNFYYQEEKCSEGEMLESIVQPINCVIKK